MNNELVAYRQADTQFLSETVLTPVGINEIGIHVEIIIPLSQCIDNV